MFRITTITIVCMILVGCGAPNATPQAMHAPPDWGPMVVIELVAMATTLLCFESVRPR